MNKSLLFSLLSAAAISLAVPGENSATAGYRWDYHPGYGYRRVGLDNAYGFGGGTTAAEGAGIGVGAAEAGLGREAEGVGQYQIDHAQAEQIHQESVKQYYENQGIQRENYSQRQEFQQQREDSEEAAARQSHADYEAHLHQMTAAHRLTDAQFDRANGILQWPYVLRGADFEELRMKIDQLYAERTPENSGVDSPDFGEIEEACKQMVDIVNSHAGQLGIDAFITAKHFAQSVAYEARFKVNGNGGGSGDGSSGSN